MKLVDLDARFQHWHAEPPTEEERQLNPHWPADHLCHYFREVENLAEAHGICFICPKSRAAGQDHYIQIFFEGSPVPNDLGRNSKGQTVRWKVAGKSLEDLSLSPSIQEESGDCWHGFVTNGDAA